MPQGAAQEGDNYPVPAEVLLNAKVGKVTVRTTDFEYKAHHKSVKDGRNKVGEKGSIVRWQWPFSLTDENYRGIIVYGETDPKISTAEGDKARQWYETILDTQIAIGDQFNTDLLEGLPCVVTVRHDEPRPGKTGLFYPCPVDDVFPAGSRDDDSVPF